MLSRLKRVLVILVPLGLLLLAGYLWLWTFPKSDNPQTDYATTVEEVRALWQAGIKKAEEIRGLRDRLAEVQAEKLKLEAVIRKIEADLQGSECTTSQHRREAKIFLRADHLRLLSGANDEEYPALRKQAEADAKIANMHSERLHSFLVIGILIVIIATLYILTPPPRRLQHDHLW